MSSATRLLTLCLFLVVAAQTHAAERELHYLEASAIDATKLLPVPPSVGSEEYQSEIDQILAVQTSRTPAQIKRLKAEEKMNLAAFAGVMPDFFTSDNLPKLDKLLKAASDDSKYFVGTGKDSFRRKRPYVEDDRIQPLGKRETDFAYPSGHATRALLWATILAQLEPSRADKLMERGREIGWDRVIGGVHHPSDIAAGRALGQAVALALLANTDFQIDLNAVKQEYAAAKSAAHRPLEPALSH